MHLIPVPHVAALELAERDGAVVDIVQDVLDSHVQSQSDPPQQPLVPKLASHLALLNATVRAHGRTPAPWRMYLLYVSLLCMFVGSIFYAFKSPENKKVRKLSRVWQVRTGNLNSTSLLCRYLPFCR